MPVTASGQTRFEWTWTRGVEFVGMNELVAFVVTNLLPAIPLEIKADSTADVEVVAACLSAPEGFVTVAARAVVTAAGASAPPPAASPTAAPDDPCSADGTISYRIEWDVEGSRGYWQASGSARFELDEIQSWAGGQVFVLVSASLTFEGENYSRHQEDLECTETFPAQAIEYSDPLGPEHDYGEGGQIILDTLGLEGVGPPNNYFGSVTLLEELAGTATCNRAGTVTTGPIGGEPIIQALNIRPHVTLAGDPDVPIFVLTEDGRMRGSDAFEIQDLRNDPVLVTTSWDIAPIDE